MKSQGILTCIPTDLATWGVLFGLLKWNDREQVYDLTPSGREWLADWVETRKAEFDLEEDES